MLVFSCLALPGRAPRRLVVRVIVAGLVGQVSDFFVGKYQGVIIRRCSEIDIQGQSDHAAIHMFDGLAIENVKSEDLVTPADPSCDHLVRILVEKLIPHADW